MLKDKAKKERLEYIKQQILDRWLISGDKGRECIIDVLLRLPEDVFTKVTGEQYIVVYSLAGGEVYRTFYSCPSLIRLFRNRYMEGPDVAKACQRKKYDEILKELDPVHEIILIALNPKLEKEHRDYIKAVIAHEFAHIWLEHLSAKHTTVEHEKAANKQAKKWGFKKEIERLLQTYKKRGIQL